MSYVKKEKTAQLNRLLTGNGLRGMLRSKIHYADDMVFSFVALFTDKSIGFEANFDRTRMNVQRTYIVNKVLVNHREK